MIKREFLFVLSVCLLFACLFFSSAPAEASDACARAKKHTWSNYEENYACLHGQKQKNRSSRSSGGSSGRGGSGSGAGIGGSAGGSDGGSGYGGGGGGGDGSSSANGGSSGLPPCSTGNAAGGVASANPLIPGVTCSDGSNSSDSSGEMDPICQKQRDDAQAAMDKASQDFSSAQQDLAITSQNFQREEEDREKECNDNFADAITFNAFRTSRCSKSARNNLRNLHTAILEQKQRDVQDKQKSYNTAQNGLRDSARCKRAKPADSQTKK